MVQRGGQYGLWWGCSRYPECDSKVGAHPDGRPLGTPANSELRLWRKAAHTIFDPLWKVHAKYNPWPEMTRSQAYAWLEETTGIAHIAEADVDGCLAVIKAMHARRSDG